MKNLTPLLVSAGEREDGCTCPHCGCVLRRGEESAVCQTCGTVQHASCWTQEGRCGSYACAPARVELGPPEAALRITADEIRRAVPAAPRRAILPGRASLQPTVPRTNRLAIAAFITALAGIPFFGALTGLVAILLGSLALGSLREKQQRGAVLALVGIFLGLVDVIVWLVVISTLITGPHVVANLEEFENDPAALEGLDPALNRAMRATVLLESTRRGFRGGVAVGTGVILNLAGNNALVVTNRHVIDPDFPGGANAERRLDGLPRVQVHFLGKTVAQGEVVWLAPHGIDLALVGVHADTDEARAAQWQAHRPVHVGAIVYAIGNPHRLGWTHTQGVVSQLRLQPSGDKPVRVIQTQAALNPGNSGGGLFDRDGFLVGINTWINDKRVSEGLGFAIALDTLLELNPPQLDVPALKAKKQ